MTLFSYVHRIVRLVVAIRVLTVHATPRFPKLGDNFSPTRGHWEARECTFTHNRRSYHSFTGISIYHVSIAHSGSPEINQLVSGLDD